jgi:hypothetical protein
VRVVVLPTVGRLHAVAGLALGGEHAEARLVVLQRSAERCCGPPQRERNGVGPLAPDDSSRGNENVPLPSGAKAE